MLVDQPIGSVGGIPGDAKGCGVRFKNILAIVQVDDRVATVAMLLVAGRQVDDDLTLIVQMGGTEARMVDEPT